MSFYHFFPTLHDRISLYLTYLIIVNLVISFFQTKDNKLAFELAKNVFFLYCYTLVLMPKSQNNPRCLHFNPLEIVSDRDRQILYLQNCRYLAQSLKKGSYFLLLLFFCPLGSLKYFVDVVSARTAVGHDEEGNVILLQIDGQTERRG